MTHDPISSNFPAWVLLARLHGEEIHYAEHGHLHTKSEPDEDPTPHALCDVEDGLQPDIGKFVATGKSEEAEQWVTCNRCRKLMDAS